MAGDDLAVKLRKAMRRGAPEVTEIVALARAFAVSKEAMARSWVEARDDAVAIVIAQHGRVLRCYRNQRHFPWLDIRLGQALPEPSIGNRRLLPGAASDAEECAGELWLGARDAARVDLLTEQPLAMSNGFAIILLHAELCVEEEEEEEDAGRPVGHRW